jgi:hypothetical protein
MFSVDLIQHREGIFATVHSVVELLAQELL